MKLTKPQIVMHNKACDLLQKDKLTFGEKLFVLEHWHEGANNINSEAGAFFTPFNLARDFAIECNGGRNIVDLCSGIGALSFAVLNVNSDIKLTCIELNSDYVAVGKKVVPEATWVHASIFDDIGTGYDLAISNPPFGNIKTGKNANDGLGGFEFSAIKKASEIARYGVFILPQMSTPFKYSGNPMGYEETMPEKVKRFIDKTKIKYEFNCGIDTSFYKRCWKGVSPICEICCFDFNKEIKEEKKIISHVEYEQTDMFKELGL